MSDVNPKPMARRGRGRGFLVGVRLQPGELAKLDNLRRGTNWTRPEAIRLILKSALQAQEETLPSVAANG